MKICNRFKKLANPRHNTGTTDTATTKVADVLFCINILVLACDSTDKLQVLKQ